MNAGRIHRNQAEGSGTFSRTTTIALALAALPEASITRSVTANVPTWRYVSATSGPHPSNVPSSSKSHEKFVTATSSEDPSPLNSTRSPTLTNRSGPASACGGVTSSFQSHANAASKYAATSAFSTSNPASRFAVPEFRFQLMLDTSVVVPSMTTPLLCTSVNP